MRSAFNRRRFAVALLVVVIAAGGSIGIAAAQSGGDSRATLADAVQATAKYHQLDVAKGDEYGLFVDKNNVACIAMDNMPEMGAMAYPDFLEAQGPVFYPIESIDLEGASVSGKGLREEVGQ